jgi:hypothetical protein
MSTAGNDSAPTQPQTTPGQHTEHTDPEPPPGASDNPPATGRRSPTGGGRPLVSPPPTDDDTIRGNLAELFAILLGEELTTEAEAALAQEAQNPPPETGTTGPTSTSEPDIHDVKGSNKALLVALTGQRLNHPEAMDLLLDLADSLTP